MDSTVENSDDSFVRSILIDFHRYNKTISPNIFDIINNTIVDTIETKLSTKLTPIFQSIKDKIAYYVSSNSSIITLNIRHYSLELKQIITVNLQYPKYSIELSNSNVVDIEQEITEKLVKVDSNFSGKSFPIIRRGLKHSPYLTTSDDRIVEYGYRNFLYSHQSEFQLIEIVDTVDHGKILLLDDLVNLAESDRISYTHSLMDIDNNNYTDKNILILGGGDGALLKELLDHSDNPPKSIIMIEIDEAVIQAVRKHIPTICSPYLESYEGPNYKIIIGDAFVHMEHMIENGESFDYVFGDLTDTPVFSENQNLWDILFKAISMGVKLLKSGGKYMTHCNGKNVPDVLRSYEDKILKKLVDEKNCTFTSTESFVSSFMEKWVFYQITRMNLVNK